MSLEILKNWNILDEADFEVVEFKKDGIEKNSSAYKKSWG